MSTTITYNTVDLNTANIITSDVTDAQAPDRTLSIFNLANANGSIITDSMYSSKTITVSGLLKATTLSALETLIDTFQAIFHVKDKNLDLGYAAGTRRYVCTAKSVKVERPVRGANWANFEVEFIATTPFGQDTSSTTALSVSGRTSQSYSDSYTFLGSAPTQLPVFTYTLTAVTGGTSATVTIGNGGNGQAIVITRTWTAADVLVIDCVNKTVQVNGIDVAFSGAFPEFPAGSQALSYVDSFTTRTFTISVVYNVMYL